MNNAAANYFVDRFDLKTSTAAEIASVFGFMNIFARGLGGFISDKANECYGRKGQMIWTQLYSFCCPYLFLFCHYYTLVGGEYSY